MAELAPMTEPRVLPVVALVPRLVAQQVLPMPVLLGRGPPVQGPVFLAVAQAPRLVVRERRRPEHLLVEEVGPLQVRQRLALGPRLRRRPGPRTRRKAHLAALGSRKLLRVLRLLRLAWWCGRAFLGSRPLPS